MAGINRLGKGPAKPGTMRPQDPNKYRTMDIFSEGTEGDKDYARMVQDIEDTQQNHSGWLFGRGAFDKGDLLYLKDEEEKRRFAEQELRDSELRSFAKMRQKTAVQRDTSPPPDPQAGFKQDKRKQAANLIRVKPVAKVKTKKAEEKPVKRVKLEDNIESTAARIKSENIKEEDSRGLAGLLGGYGSDDSEVDHQVEVKEEGDKRKILPLPDVLVKTEIKTESSSQEHPSPLTKVEEVDHGESESPDSADSF